MFLELPSPLQHNNRKMGIGGVGLAGVSPRGSPRNSPRCSPRTTYSPRNTVNMHTNLRLNNFTTDGNMDDKPITGLNRPVSAQSARTDSARGRTISPAPPTMI